MHPWTWPQSGQLRCEYCTKKVLNPRPWWVSKWVSEKSAMWNNMLVSELGTRQHCRDNVTMFSGLKAVEFCIFTIFAVATPSSHRALIFFLYFFSCPWGSMYSITLSRCRCRKAKQLSRAQLWLVLQVTPPPYLSSSSSMSISDLDPAVHCLRQVVFKV